VAPDVCVRFDNAAQRILDPTSRIDSRALRRGAGAPDAPAESHGACDLALEKGALLANALEVARAWRRHCDGLVQGREARAICT
jgi:hypothetical protein